MLKKLLSSSFVILLFSFYTLGQTAGGPDEYGYTWIHSNAPGGPVYDWKDIVIDPNTTRIYGLLDDNSAGWLPIGFDFKYYWGEYDKIRIGSNGWISFSNIGNIAHGFPNIPTAGGAGDNFIAPFMTDLNFEGELNEARAFYWSNNVDSFIVTWFKVPFWTNTTPDYTGSNTFQVILCGADNSITFQYQEQTGVGQSTTLIDAVIGIENVTGTIGLECVSDVYPIAPAAIKFYYPQNVTLQIPDLEPAWNQNESNEGSFHFKGSVAALTTNITNVGNTEVVAPTNAIANFLNENDVSSYSAQRQIGTLQPGEDTTIGFGDLLYMSTPGDHTYRVSVSNGDDINSNNNNNDVEMVVVDSANGEIVLSYFSPDSAPTGVLMWQGGGGNSGAGMDVDLPFYPATIKAVEVNVSAGDFLQPFLPLQYGFTIYVRERDQLGGPGTIIGNETANPSSLFPSQWNRLDFTTPVTVTEPFLLQWIMDGDSIAIATDNRPPYSRRSYEILNGGWAKYRSGETEDLAIKLIIDSDGAKPDTTALSATHIPLQANENFLGQNYPNPSDGSTVIEFYLADHTDAILSIYDNAGNLVNRFEYISASKGSHRLELNTDKLAAGLYSYALTTKSGILSKKMVVK